MKVAIQGHPIKGKEVIKILESLGGINKYNYYGNSSKAYYEIHGDLIQCMNTKSDDYKYYTLEEFEKEFPFKIGDGVIFPVKIGWASGKVTGLTYRENKLKYEVDTRTAGYHYVEPHKLQLYPMKKERNITLTLEKAKEWYKKGGELKEVALQAYSKEELTKVELPKTWKEFCDNYRINDNEAYFGSCCTVSSATATYRHSLHDRNVCPSKKSAEAHLAMIQLEQLRDCWCNGWKSDWNDNQQAKYCIIYSRGFKIHILYETRRFLSFPTMEMAEEFLECFRDLIEKAGDLI